jgi:hypothetical protein
MQPHTELIKSESQSYAVEDRDKVQPFTRRSGCEQECRSHDGKQEDAEVQVMNVGSTEMQMEVRDVTGHYEKDQNAYAHECEQKAGKHNPSEALGIHVGSSEA